MGNVEQISSRDNQRLIRLRKVRDGRDRSHIFIEGRRLIKDALRSGVEIEECYFAADFADSALVDDISNQGTFVAEVAANVFAGIADTAGSQGIVAIAKRPTWSFETIEYRLGGSALSIVIWLKEPNNPSNLGAILRTSEAAGVAAVLISKNGVDPHSPKAIRGAMGSAFRLPVVQNVELSDALSLASKHGMRVTAVDVSGAANYVDIDWRVPRLLVFGSEAHGLSSEELEKADERIVIEMAGEVESLNLAMSAGVILFEAKRQNS